MTSPRPRFTVSWVQLLFWCIVVSLPLSVRFRPLVVGFQKSFSSFFFKYCLLCSCIVLRFLCPSFSSIFITQNLLYFRSILFLCFSRKDFWEQRWLNPASPFPIILSPPPSPLPFFDSQLLCHPVSVIVCSSVAQQLTFAPMCLNHETPARVVPLQKYKKC